MDLPKDAFLQWTGWVMSPRYLFDDAELDALQNFPKYQGALRGQSLPVKLYTAMVVHPERREQARAGEGVST